MQSSANRAAILGLSTATPTYVASQREIAGWFCDYFELPERLKKFVFRLHERTGIERRCSVLPDFSSGSEPRLFDRKRACGIEDRMAVYRSEAPGLAARACRGALVEAGLAPDEITHLIVVTSTGFMTPGPDIAIARALELEETVERTIVAMHGCVGGVVGLALAAQIARGDPTARVLMVCVELCSIHFGSGTDRQMMVANSLFADGAAAAVVAFDSLDRDCLLTLGARRTMLVPDSTDALGWNLVENRFELRLSRDLPRLIRAVTASFVSKFTEPADPTRGRSEPVPFSSWVVHPGGAAILEAVARSLSLSERNLHASRETLRNFGNLSSAAVLFSLDREIRQVDRVGSGTRGLILGFGPGLCVDGVEFSLRG